MRMLGEWKELYMANRDYDEQTQSNKVNKLYRTKGDHDKQSQGNTASE
jgi:hypothetical protein